jgi:hypothetical protein
LCWLLTFWRIWWCFIEKMSLRVGILWGISWRYVNQSITQVGGSYQRFILFRMLTFCNSQK